ncbi:twin-arginine translocase TatA/TatE family subunit [Candidatus Bathyarchaeota archaeon]|nr:MAG: twin-arginine translocase TatA/TatE family subunit [Candidatus Hecatellales archaeon ex4484_218]RJX16447.1 MAG: twin-arginine translocase TatA/TatE family subunit [Candidatus Bathyarchaeota archaeon]
MIIGQEWIIIAVIAVILIFGAKKLPELARSIGRARGEFERGKIEVEKELKEVETSKPTKETLMKIAKDLGIETEGKSEEEIRQEIAKKVG